MNVAVAEDVLLGQPLHCTCQLLCLCDEVHDGRITVAEKRTPCMCSSSIGGGRAALCLAGGEVFSHLCAPGGGVIFAVDVGGEFSRQGRSMNAAQPMPQFYPMTILQRDRKAVTPGDKGIKDGGRCARLGKEAPVCTGDRGDDLQDRLSRQPVRHGHRRQVEIGAAQLQKVGCAGSVQHPKDSCMWIGAQFQACNVGRVHVVLVPQAGCEFGPAVAASISWIAACCHGKSLPHPRPRCGPARTVMRNRLHGRSYLFYGRA